MTPRNTFADQDMESTLKQSNRSKLIPFGMLALSLITAGATAQAQKHDRDTHRHSGDRHSHDNSIVLKGNRDRRRNHHDRRNCFECRFERRQERQHARIRSGLRNGDLTRKEAKKLRKQQRRIARMERRYGADGRYTRSEKRRIIRALDRASDRIYRYRHNDRYRPADRYAYDYDSRFRSNLWYFDHH